MTTSETLIAEIMEALDPLATWRVVAPTDRTIDLAIACQDALITMVWWGWSITVTRPRGAWSIQAANGTGKEAVKARGTGRDYYAAAYQLRQRLLDEVNSTSISQAVAA